MLRTLALAMLLAMLAGCGQKGPLYHPDDSAAAERYGNPQDAGNTAETPADAPPDDES